VRASEQHLMRLCL